MEWSDIASAKIILSNMIRNAVLNLDQMIVEHKLLSTYLAEEVMEKDDVERVMQTTQFLLNNFNVVNDEGGDSKEFNSVETLIPPQ